MSDQSLSAWCTPETILVLARPTDEPAQILSAIRHSGAGSARVLLAQLAAQERGSMTASFRPRVVLPWPGNLKSLSSRLPVDQRVTWSDVTSQCFFISSVSLRDLPMLIKAFKVGRVVLTAGRGAIAGERESVETTLLETVDAPLWIVGPNVAQRSGEASQIRRVLFPVTFASGLRDSLHFACEYTRALRGTLTLLHIFDRWAMGGTSQDRTPVAVRSRLPLSPLFRYGPPCGMEIAVREGEFSREVIHFNEQRPHDVILMDGFSSGAAFHDVLFQAACPVFVFRASRSALAEPVQSFEPTLAEVSTRKVT